jgi:hypothetical protein
MAAVEYPEDSFQAIAASGAWWEADDSKELLRGQLVWAHVQFFDEIPFQLLPVRADDRSHGEAVLRAEPLRANQRASEHEALPVAALPRRDGADAFIVNRAKRRPCLILAGVQPTRVTDRDGRGQPNWTVAPFAVAAPYYSADQDGRAGYNPVLVERIRHARYRQFFVDRLPVGSTSESILRFDQMYPVSHNAQNHERTGFRLSVRALTLVDEWLDWFVTGDAPQGELAAFRELIADMETQAKP